MSAPFIHNSEKKLLFATNNLHKLSEIQQILHSNFSILSLKDIGCIDELPETHNTLEGNALQKASYVHEKYGLDCFADDTGLEIDALDGAPGVYSARFAGEKVTYKQNRDKVLDLLKGVEDRKARFRTVIALIYNEKKYFFEGAVEGIIIDEERGEEGFGYDPVFVPAGFNTTFAEMSAEQKNKISHRGLAVAKLTAFLNKI